LSSEEIYFVCNTDTARNQEHGAGYLQKIMRELKSPKSMIVPAVGLSVLAIIILSYWSSTLTLHRLDVTYAGGKTLHL